MKKRTFNCLCGISFIGSEKDFDFHLFNLCPVFEEAYTKIKNETPPKK